MSVVSKKFSASLDSMLVLLLLCLVTAFSSGCGSKASLDPAKPVTLTIWHVYGNQTNSPFNDTIEKFNASEGKAQGVIVKVASVSSSNVIDKALFASAKQEPGAVPLPDLFTAYPRVIPAMHDKLLHWDKYLDKEDLAVYQPEFLAEGYQDKELLMLPADSYYHLQRQAKIRLLIMLGIILLLSLLSASYFSKKYVDPLVADLQQLQQNPDASPQANVLELNQFFEFLQNHSEQQAEKLRQLQSENNQVQKQYGLAAMRLQEAQEKQKQTANQYIHLEEQLAALQNEIQQVRLQMEQTQQEKLQAQQEREQAQQQLNFAQAALEKAIEKKLESVDPDSCQMFIDNLATLTPKEEDIFNLYVQGCSTKAIISQLGITENTLKYHNKNIYSKLGVKTRKELLQYIELMRNAEH